VEVVDCLTEDELDFLIVRLHHNGTGQTEQVAKRHMRERGEVETYIQYIHIIPNSSFSFLAHILIFIHRIRRRQMGENRFNT
jgi:hypothetical protein